MVVFELSTDSVVRRPKQLQLDPARLLRRESAAKELVKLFKHEVTRAVADLYPKDVNQLVRAAKWGCARLSKLRTNTNVACDSRPS